MKLVQLFVVMVMVVLAGGCGGGSGQKAGSGEAALDMTGWDQPIEGRTATLVVHGMGCPQCASNVDLQLARVRGVEKITVDMSSGRVKVNLSEANRPTKMELGQAIKDSGFTLVDIQEP